jgi:hypothetical protein
MHFFMFTGGPSVDVTTIDNWIVNRIETVTGHNGTPTKALYSEMKQTQGGSTQDALMIQPPGETSDLYISYWIKFQPNLVQLMTPPSWRLLFEWKTGTYGDDGDYRLAVALVTWGPDGPLSWYVYGDNVAAASVPVRQIFWEKYTTTTAQTLGDWMKFEVFWHRSTGPDGRVWMAVNGQVIVDMPGPNKIRAPINRIAPNLYTGTAFPVYQWMDDLEIWDGFPPVGNNPPYAPH